MKISIKARVLLWLEMDLSLSLDSCNILFKSIAASGFVSLSLSLCSSYQFAGLNICSKVSVKIPSSIFYHQHLLPALCAVMFNGKLTRKKLGSCSMQQTKMAHVSCSSNHRPTLRNLILTANQTIAQEFSWFWHHLDRLGLVLMPQNQDEAFGWV